MHTITLLEGLTTAEAAKVLNRTPQALRRWAAYETGPIRPLRVHGRLMWMAEDIQKLLQRTDADGRKEAA